MNFYKYYVFVGITNITGSLDKRFINANIKNVFVEHTVWHRFKKDIGAFYNIKLKCFQINLKEAPFNQPGMDEVLKLLIPIKSKHLVIKNASMKCPDSFSVKR